MQNPFIIGENIYLRALEESDTEMIAKTENHPESRETLFYGLPTNYETNREKWQKLAKNSDCIVFIICSKSPDKPIGIVAFHRIDWIGRMAIFYIAIADVANRSKGIGNETMKLLMDYAFNTLNLHRVQLHVAVKNENAIALYKKNGFKIEGTLREAMFQQGTYHDFYVMGLLKDDFIKK